MAAIAYTKVTATTNQLVYAWTGDAAGTLSYATMLADALTATGTCLKSTLTAVGGQCDSNAKAVSALLTGEAFTGAGGSSITTNVQCSILYTATTSLKTVPALTAVDDGGTNNPALTLTPDAGGGGTASGLLYITLRHSIVQ